MNIGINVTSLITFFGKEFLKDFYKKVKKKKDFRNYFLKCNREFVFNACNGDYFDKTMQAFFTSDNLEKLSFEYAKMSGDDIQRRMKNDLKSIMKELSIDDENYNFFIDTFIVRFENFLKEKYPDIYNQYLLSKLDNNNQVRFDQLISEIKSLKDIIIKKEKLFTTIIDVEIELLETSKYNLTLDFFKSDDKCFIDEFSKKVLSNSHIINIRCFDIEESLYSVLCEIKTSNIDKRVRIVKNLEAWNKLLESEYLEENCIYIAYFYADIITAIPNNINIIFYDEDNKEADYIILSKRRLDTYRKLLGEIGLNEEKVNRIVEDTNGVFCSLKSELFYGKYVYSYSNEIRNNDNVLKAICVGYWNDNENDKELFGKDYKNLKKSINTYYKKGRNPLFLLKELYGCKYYRLANRKKALLQFIDDLDDSFICYLNDIVSLLNSNASRELKASFLMNILIVKNENLQANVELIECIEKAIDNIFNECSIQTISDYAFILTELSPDRYLELFTNRKSEIMRYLNDTRDLDLLYPVRTFLKMSQYSKSWIEILFDLHNEIDNKQNKERIEQIIKDVFLVWINIASIDLNSKISILKERIKQDEFTKDVIYSGMTQTNAVSTHRFFYYLKTDLNEQVTREELFQAIDLYLKIYIDNISNYIDINRTLELLERFDNNTFLKYKADLINIINQFSDYEKEIVYNELIKIVSKHRFHKTASWSRSEDYLQNFLEIKDAIKFKNNLYKYKYIFKANGEIPLLEPYPYETKTDYYRKNKEKENILIENTIKMIKKDGYSFNNIIELFDNEKCSIGYHIFRCFDNEEFRDESLQMLLKYKKDEIIIDYAKSFVNDDRIFVHIISETRKQINSAKLIANLWRLKTYIDIDTNLDNELQEVKKEFWHYHVFYDPCDNMKFFLWLKNNIINYGSYSEYINLLYRFNWISDELLFKNLLDLTKFKDKNREYLLTNLLVKVKKYVTADIRRIKKMAELEFNLLDVIDRDNFIYLTEYCSYSAKYYLEYINNFYVHDIEVEEKTFNHKLYGLFFRLKFCPGMVNDTIDETLFFKWIDEFNLGMKNQKQEKLISLMCGKVLANSPRGIDNNYPHEIIRSYIEKNYNKDLEEGYITTLYNNRGVYNLDGGDSTYLLAKNLEDNANKIRELSPKTASIYDSISSQYKLQSYKERERNEKL